MWPGMAKCELELCSQSDRLRDCAQLFIPMLRVYECDRGCRVSGVSSHCCYKSKLSLFFLSTIVFKQSRRTRIHHHDQTNDANRCQKDTVLPSTFGTA